MDVWNRYNKTRLHKGHLILIAFLNTSSAENLKDKKTPVTKQGSSQ